MNEARYGLIVEGPYDEGVFRELVCKIVAHDLDPVVRPCGGVPQLLKRFPGFLREFQHVRQAGE